MKRLLTFLFLATVVFAGCNKDNGDKTVTIGDNIIGKWVKADVNGQPAPTNEKVVFTFLSTTEAFQSGSLNEQLNDDALWADGNRFNININGQTITATIQRDEHHTAKLTIVVKSINDNEFTADMNVVLERDGSVVFTKEETQRFVKVTDNYTQAVLGIWEGQVTSEQSEYDDNLEHRWQYNSDGTYVYYNQDGDSWIPNPTNTLNEYFVDGNLLCMRWISNGTEYREWWEIASIENNVMSWTALRKRADGTTYTASFSMRKVTPEGYVDLGLPSGTLWRTTNEPNPADSNDFYTYDEAVAAFGNKLPDKPQINELIVNCQWAFDEGNHTVIATGPNGNTLVLPLMGKRSCDGNVKGVGINACYWSTTAKDDELAWRLDIVNNNVYIYDGNKCAGASIRLVF